MQKFFETLENSLRQSRGTDQDKRAQTAFCSADKTAPLTSGTEGVIGFLLESVQENILPHNHSMRQKLSHLDAAANRQHAAKP